MKLLAFAVIMLAIATLTGQYRTHVLAEQINEQQQTINMLVEAVKNNHTANKIQQNIIHRITRLR